MGQGEKYGTGGRLVRILKVPCTVVRVTTNLSSLVSASRPLLAFFFLAVLGLGGLAAPVAHGWSHEETHETQGLPSLGTDDAACALCHGLAVAVVAESEAGPATGPVWDALPLTPVAWTDAEQAARSCRGPPTA